MKLEAGQVWKGVRHSPLVDARNVPELLNLTLVRRYGHTKDPLWLVSFPNPPKRGVPRVCGLEGDDSPPYWAETIEYFEREEVILTGKLAP